MKNKVSQNDRSSGTVTERGKDGSKRRQNIEILAPAGGFDSVIAAAHSGADAVYIGAKSFSARASAHNFDEEELKECVRYCHRRGMKVHLALNTLIFDDEMARAVELVKTAARADIDALIIQDLGLVSLIKKTVPGLPLHASTQLSVHTPYGARALYEMGFERVVLSRELSLDEIREIREACPEVELEVFVHGALCMCVSGQCYFSAMLGGRSANRGMCAQPCRLPMRYKGNDHALSLKDNGSLSYLRELEVLGIESAKIEGRMKRPEYVAAAVRAAKEARDLGFVTEATEERLRSVFSRTGFTDGYLRGELGRSMFGYRQKSDVVSADSKLLKEIRAGYKDEYKSVEIDFDFIAHTGEKMRLKASDDVHTAQVESENETEKAVNVPLTEERASANLSKTGNTPFRIKNIRCDISPDASAPASAINALRREALEQLGAMRENCHNYTVNDIDISDVLNGGERTSHKKIAVVQSLELASGLGDMDTVFVDIYGLEDKDRLRSMINGGHSIGVEAPRVTFGTENEVFERLKALRKLGVTELRANNIAAVYMGRLLGYRVHAGFGMNIANSYTLMWAREYGIVSAELSCELDLKRIERLYKSIPVGIMRYGNMPLMITRNTPAGAEMSCKNDGYLQDRKDENFIIRRREGYCEIYNCVPVLMPQEDYKLRGEVFAIFNFTVENSVEKMKKTMRKLRKNLDFERMTHGLYIRGVK